MIETLDSQPEPLMAALNNPPEGEQLGLVRWHSFTANVVDARRFQAENFGDETLGIWTGMAMLTCHMQWPTCDSQS